MKETIAIWLIYRRKTKHQDPRVTVHCELTGFNRTRVLPDGVTLQDVAANICRIISAKPHSIARVDETSVVLILDMKFKENLQLLRK